MNLSIKNKPDSIGIISSTLCLIHCLATPLLFAAQIHIVNGGHGKPFWWSNIDLIFLLISSLAIYKASLNGTKEWIKIALWGSFLLLTFIIVNEKMAWYHIPEPAIYIPTLSLIFLHIYNNKYCQCKDESCCVNDRQKNG